MDSDHGGEASRVRPAELKHRRLAYCKRVPLRYSHAVPEPPRYPPMEGRCVQSRLRTNQVLVSFTRNTGVGGPRRFGTRPAAAARWSSQEQRPTWMKTGELPQGAVV